ncbi:hypothetical protein BGX38DRAFT_1267151 [Terfezia claveryi]|nr:hypothetical protein BGX38DRAFT_1267151 [Terfezia claveryi]
MYSKLTFVAIVSAVITSTSFAQNTTSSARDKAITDAFLVCSNAAGSTCPNTYKITSCLEGIEPSIWGKYDANHNATNISATPLGDVIKNTKLKTCACSESQLQELEDCVKCVRKGSNLTGELDLFGVGFIAERVCGVVLPSFELSQKERTDNRTVIPSISKTNWKTTSTNNQTDTTTPTLTAPSGGSNETTATTLGSNRTLQMPTPTQMKDQPSASQSSGAAAATVVVRHAALPAGMAVVVALGMSFL